ncbi:antigen 5 like allergen Cul n 1 [Drosophila grimshawi]|uniref:antigen 5 like allergen Cul n 1 n=1 Tax=Drosophila grimshawi TaxID=7222 RepID=UPI000C8709B4|nr:antigen 5 like allergen Cul n 1 [Drosophila grimshawi]
MRHFICHMDTELAKYVATIPDTLTLRTLILDYHNDFRHMLAGGGLTTNSNETFPAASRMRELIWDEELAHMARIHASTVSFKHTMCRSVVRFPNAGEALGLVFASSTRRTIKELLDLTLVPMFEEYRVAEDPDNLVNEFDSSKHHVVAHFTLLVNDRVSRVGCAFVVASGCEQEAREGYCFFLTCHYDFVNMEKSFVYKTGDPASQCCIWRAPSKSKKFRHLCGNSGAIFPMDHGELDQHQRNFNLQKCS